MTQRRWLGLAALMAVSFVILLMVRDALALAAAIMCGVSLVKATEGGAS